MRSALVVFVSVLAVGGLAACGDDGEQVDEPSAGSSSEPAGTSDSEDDPSSDTGEEVSLPDDICSLLTADEVGTAVGGPVTLGTGPTGDCEFKQEDPRAVSGIFGVVPDAATNGGYDAYLSGIAGTVTDPVLREITGLGDAATTFTGVPGFGGSTQVMAGGVVDRGSFLEQTTLTQAQDMSAEQLDPIAEALLRLLDSKIG